MARFSGHRLALSRIRRAVDGGAEIRYAYRDGRGLPLFMIEIDRFVCPGIS